MKLFDSCWFNPLWNDRVDPNFYSRKFPKRTILYCNPPFSCCEAFLVRCFILFAFFGVDIVLIMPKCRYEACKFAKTYIDPVVEKVPTEQFAFRGFGET